MYAISVILPWVVNFQRIILLCPFYIKLLSCCI
nr:MAG TPA: hypothetical protein [Caudoviricetes sp.]